MTLTKVFCGNQDCPEARRGRRQVIGEVQTGAVARLHCPKCKQYTTARA